MITVQFKTTNALNLSIFVLKFCKFCNDKDQSYMGYFTVLINYIVASLDYY